MLATTTRLRLALIAALCCIAVGVAFFVGSRHRGPPDTGAPSGGSGQTELQNLDEEMLIGESVVPPLEGTTWGSMVAIPRGPQPSVSPADCVLFLSQGPAGAKGLAMRSSKNASIGVTLSVVGWDVGFVATVFFREVNDAAIFALHHEKLVSGDGSEP